MDDPKYPRIASVDTVKDQIAVDDRHSYARTVLVPRRA